MFQRTTSALVLLTVGALAMTVTTTPAAFAANSREESQSGVPAPAPSVDAQSDAPQSGAVDEAGAESPTTTPEIVPTDDTPIAIIAQFGDDSVGTPWYQRVFDLSSSTRHETVKEHIETSVKAVIPGADVTDVRDYTHALGGFAIQTPAPSLSAIKTTEGVKAAFIERYHKPMVVEGDVGALGAEAVDPALQNVSSLEVTRTNQTTQKGDRQVVEVIDTGIEVTHQTFFGSMDGVDMRLSRGNVEALVGKLPHGKTGAYPSSKIPSVFDYADNDTDVLPKSNENLSHGTHVAVIAAANMADLQGTAPHAQIIVTKVASDKDGSIPSSTVLAVLDDVVVIKPDSINFSLGEDTGMDTEAGTTYTEVYESLANAKMAVNAVVGNSYSSAYSNYSGKNEPFAADPGAGTVSEPTRPDDEFG